MEVTLITHLETPAETLVIPVSQENTEAILAEIADAFSSEPLFLGKDFSAKEGETLSFYPQSGQLARRVLLLGLGKTRDPETLRRVFRSFVFRQRAILSGFILDLSEWTSLRHEGSEQEPAYVDAAVQAALLGGYEVGMFKEPSPDTKILLETLHLLISDSQEVAARSSLSKATAISEAQIGALNLVNLPGNRLDATALAQRAVELGKTHGFDVRVLDKQQIVAAGLKALLAVNQGSTRPPAFILMEYKGGGSKKVALVGKGVTFDTGGISLKGRENLHYMKSDMGGAAAVIGTMEAAARLKLPIHLIGVVPATDNMPDGGAIVPGDVIDTYSGFTVEVLDTDAEGRLILADGLAYVHRTYQPDVIIDLATLTGACVFALGYHAAGMFTNNDELAEQLSKAGQSVKERVWRLPLWDDYARQLNSDVADISNLGGRPAGAVTAAKFLEKFTESHPAWAHLDIAGTALGDSEFAKGKSGTGFGVRLLVAYLERL